MRIPFEKLQRKMGYIWITHADLQKEENAIIAEIEEWKHSEETPLKLAIDLENREEISSPTIGLLIRIKKKVEERGGVFCTVNISDTCEKLFKDLRLNTVFTTYKTAESFTAFHQSIETGDLSGLLMWEGDIIVSNIDKFKLKMNNFIHCGLSTITIDMTQVAIIDSVGVASLIEYTRRLKNRNGSLKLKNVNKEIYDFLTLLSLDRRIEIENML